jgi:GDP-L-fucose synthase
MQSHLNVGFGSDITIRELAYAIAKATTYSGVVNFDSTKHDGVHRK